nr:PLP-dependent transferase [Bacteroidales bacterium]
IRGIETLALRVNKQCDNAELVAQFLASHPLVKRVNYPGLNTHPNHEIAEKQQSRFGAMISFSLKTDTVDAGSMVCSSTTLFKLAESLGGVKSLICQPALMTHKSIPKDVRHAAGIDDSLIRISCGIENADDLIDDLKQALNKI